MLHKTVSRDRENCHEHSLPGFLASTSLVKGDVHGYKIKCVEGITACCWKPVLTSFYSVIDSLEKERLIECYIVEHYENQRGMCKLTNTGYRVLMDSLKKKIKVYASILYVPLNINHVSLKYLNIIKTNGYIK